MSSPPAAKKSILQKGNACSTCKARKVRCDAVKPRCGSCTRSARFRGINPDSITCDYLPPPLKRSSSTTPSKRAAAKRRRAATDDLAATAVLVDTVERELVQPSHLVTTNLLPPLPPATSIDVVLPLAPLTLPAPIPSRPPTTPSFLASPETHSPLSLYTTLGNNQSAVVDSPSSPSFAGIFSRTPFSFEPVDPFFVYVDSPVSKVSVYHDAWMEGLQPAFPTMYMPTSSLLDNTPTSRSPPTLPPSGPVADIPVTDFPHCDTFLSPYAFYPDPSFPLLS